MYYLRQQVKKVGNRAVTDFINAARREAIVKHGELKSGPQRWSRLLAEEWQEVEDELQTLMADPGDGEAVDRLLVELAQLAQLTMGVIKLVLENKLEEEK